MMLTAGTVEFTVTFWLPGENREQLGRRKVIRKNDAIVFVFIEQ
jgi:hypothetical protein